VKPARLAEGGQRRALPGKSAGTWLLLLVIRSYIAFLSPIFGGACRFYPSCSNYAAEAIARHGARHGVSLALRRLLRCNPFNKGGLDPVPDELPSESTARLPQTHGEPR
jgi:putative membrane protein insertion efficiency factor